MASFDEGMPQNQTQTGVPSMSGYVLFWW